MASRGELFRLLDLLCEETASLEDCARLEELTRQDTAALRIYLDTLEIHGLLTWDAGLCFHDALEDVVEAAGLQPASPRPQFRPESRRFRHYLGAGLIGTVALTVIVALLLTLPMNPVQEPSPVAQTNPSEDLQSPPEQISEVVLPSVPRISTAKPETPPRVVPEIDNHLLTDYSTDAVVSFINDELSRVWQENDVEPSPAANDSQWARRVYLDLTGRIPTERESLSFIDDPSPQKRDRLVQRLLQSREFSQNMATTWVNLLVGRSREREKNRKALFTFLDRQFRENRSWAETVGELLTAQGTAEENAAAGFLLAHLNNQAVPATAIVSRVFLGEQLHCSQCHQHPDVKSWSQEQFWELNAFFQQCQVATRTVVDQETGTRTRLRELVDRPEGGPTFYEDLNGVMKVSYPKFAGVEIDSSDETNRRQALVGLMTSGPHPQVARAFVNRVWGQFFGQAFTRNVDDMGPHQLPTHPLLLDGLTEAFVAHDYDVKLLVEWICRCKAYQLESKPAERNRIDLPEQGQPPLFSRMYLKPMTAEQLYDSIAVAAGQEPVMTSGLNEDREQFVQQFFTAVDTEENSECSTFDGSLPQALMMMNGPEILAALEDETSSLLSEVLRSQESEVEKIRRLCLVTLSRYPQPEELNAVRQLLRKHVKSQTERDIPARIAVNEGLRDIYWAYLNSSEFSVNH